LNGNCAGKPAPLLKMSPRRRVLYPLFVAPVGAAPPGTSAGV